MLAWKCLMLGVKVLERMSARGARWACADAGCNTIGYPGVVLCVLYCIAEEQQTA